MAQKFMRVYSAMDSQESIWVKIRLQSARLWVASVRGCLGVGRYFFPQMNF